MNEEQGSPVVSSGSVQHSPRQASLHDCDELELTLPSFQIMDSAVGESVGLGEGLSVSESVGLEAFFIPSFCRLRVRWGNFHGTKLSIIVLSGMLVICEDRSAVLKNIELTRNVASTYSYEIDANMKSGQ